MEQIIGLKEFRLNVEKYAKTAQKGSSIIIMRRSKPIFKITPVEDDYWEEVVDFTCIKKGGVHIDDILSRL